MSQSVDTIWVFLMVDDKGMEGVMTVQTENKAFPLLCTNQGRLALLRPLAEKIASITNKPYRIAEFTYTRDMHIE